MAMRDWNNNGKKDDAFDNYMDYKLYQNWEKSQNEQEHPKNYTNNSSSNSEKSSDAIINIIGAIIIFALLFVISLERNFFLSLLGYNIDSLTEFEKLFFDIIVAVIDFVVLILIIGFILSLKAKICKRFKK